MTDTDEREDATASAPLASSCGDASDDPRAPGGPAPSEADRFIRGSMVARCSGSSLRAMRGRPVVLGAGCWLFRVSTAGPRK